MTGKWNLVLMDLAEDIDNALGKGYAKSHPELLCSLVQAYAISGLGDELRNLTIGVVSEDLHDIARALGDR